MFLHWGTYAGPAQGEWYMERAGVKPDAYRAMVTSGSQAWLADRYDPTTWTDLAKQAGMRWMVLTARRHDGLALFPSSHPAAWTTARHRGAATSSPTTWPPCGRPGCGWGCTTRPSLAVPRLLRLDRRGLQAQPVRVDHRPHAQGERSAAEGDGLRAGPHPGQPNGVVDLLWRDGGWLGQQGSDRDAAFFWEPGAGDDRAPATLVTYELACWSADMRLWVYEHAGTLGG